MRMRPRLWALLATCAAALPLVPALSSSRLFYVRDLSLSFWYRYVWLRRALWSGSWPLWDPYLGGGQAAFADGLHQMFFPPALLLKFVGSEVLGFNLWVALPLPVAACGAFLFFARRFSAAASALGAVAFAMSGPILSSLDFPNLSWSVAGVPWVLWAVDRVASDPQPRAIAVLALTVALQALAGEPVTLLATLTLTSLFALIAAPPAAVNRLPMIARRMISVAIGLALGLMLAAIQLIPMQRAAALSERSTVILSNSWALHPLALIETVSLHLYGDYFTIPSVTAAPWMPLVNGGREPFFFSIYYGVPLLALALLGLLAPDRRRWALFWAAPATGSLLLAFGQYTPIYPFLQHHLPLLGSFRFPVKYLIVLSMAIAAAAAAGWDAIAGNGDSSATSGALGRARISAIAFAAAVGAIAFAAGAACLYLTTPAAFRLYAIAQWLGARDPVEASAFMLRTIPQHATVVLVISVAAAVAIAMATPPRKTAQAARYALYALIIGDLMVRSWGINPVLDAKYLAPPAWLSHVADMSEWRFYFGGKMDGTLDPNDPDGSRRFMNPPGLVGSASRAAINGQVPFYPSAWHAREMLSYDLPVLWPKVFDTVARRFFSSGREARDRFLDRTATRYRMLTPRVAPGRRPLTPIPYAAESFLFDFGPSVPQRAAIASDVRIVSGIDGQIDALFGPGWDSHTTAIVERQSPAAGTAGPPVAPFARFVEDGANRVRVQAGAGSDGGYLVLLDSYSDDWHVRVDGQPAAMVRTNAVFRSVRLAPGEHMVEFAFRPTTFFWGAVASGVAGLLLLAMSFAPAQCFTAAGERPRAQRIS
jgi:hypothetical protein